MSSIITVPDEFQERLKLIIAFLLLLGDMDTADCPLMGAHGYCSQEMVHLLLFGKAISNTFDGDKTLDEYTVLKGIRQQSDIGLLSLFEHYDSIVVGEFLKSPAFPIWLVCSESHFTGKFAIVIFFCGLKNIQGF